MEIRDMIRKAESAFRNELSEIANRHKTPNQMDIDSWRERERQSDQEKAQIVDALANKLRAEASATENQTKLKSLTVWFLVALITIFIVGAFAIAFLDGFENSGFSAADGLILAMFSGAMGGIVGAFVIVLKGLFDVKK